MSQRCHQTGYAGDLGACVVTRERTIGSANPPVASRFLLMFAKPELRLSFRTLVLGTLIGMLAIFFIMVLSGDEALGQPVGCGSTITKNTKLERDLINCPGNGIVIGADDITLDLNGHVIDGDVPHSPVCGFDIGVDNSAGHDDVIIEDGTIREFDDGVDLIGATRNTVTELEIRRNNCDGVFLTDTNHSEIRENSIERNDFRAIVIRAESQKGPQAIAGSNEISENQMSGNDHSGVSLFRTVGNRIVENSISGAGRSNGTQTDFGIELVTSTANIVSENDLAHHLEVGIPLFEGSDRNRIADNEVSDTAGASSLNALGGIAVFASSRNRITDNLVFASDSNGIAIGVPFADIGGPAKANIASRNVVLRNRRDGIRIGADSHDALIQLSVANRNGDDGIHVSAPTTTLTRSIANHNVDLGIQAVPGVTDGGGNTARRNGNPRQCVNVSCN